jgi:hypothetical protein
MPYSNLPQHLPRADKLLGGEKFESQDICGNRGFDESKPFSLILRTRTTGLPGPYERHSVVTTAISMVKTSFSRLKTGA